MLDVHRWLKFEEGVIDRTRDATKIQRSAYLPEGAIPIIDQGQEFIAGYTNDLEVAYRGTLPVVLFGDHTRALKYIDFPFAAGADGIKVLEPCREIEARFLWYFLRSQTLPNDGYSRHFKHLRALQVPVTSIESQRHAIDVLSRAENIVRMRRQAEQKAKEIIPALFLDMFGDPATNPKGWVFRAIGDAAEIQGGLQVTTKRAILPLELPYLRVANVHRTHLDLSEIKLIRATEAELNRTRLLPGDLLVIEGHGNPAEIGRVGIWPGGIDPCVHQNHLIRVRCTPASFHPIYVWAYLNSEDGRRFLLREGKTTSGLNTISVSNVKGVKVPAPPIALQQEFARRIEEINALQASQHAASSLANQTFQSLLSGVFAQ